MNAEPRERDDYADRQVEAARRVLIDVGQILSSFADCVVIVGGWTPYLLLGDADEPHIGSIDVDLALDAARLGEGRYAELLKLLLDTKRYRKGAKDFQLVVEVDLGDNEPPVKVEVEFLAAKDVTLRGSRPKLMAGFRVLQADGCAAAFHGPIGKRLSGKSVNGAENTVRLRVASLPDFLIMKALAIDGRDKPKDVYDLCYVLDHCPEGIESLAADWRQRSSDQDVRRAVQILQEKFASVSNFGPRQLVEFHHPFERDTAAMLARRAYELVSRFLRLLDSG